MSRRFARPSPALVVACIALVVAMTSPAWGDPVANSAASLKKTATKALGLSKKASKTAKKANKTAKAASKKADQALASSGPQGPPGPTGAAGQSGATGLTGQAGAAATKLFAYIRDPVNAAAVVDYGSGVTGVAEPSSTDGEYTVTFNRSVENCVVHATPGWGDPPAPPGSSRTLNTTVPTIEMEDGTAAEVNLLFLRPDNDVDYGVPIDTSFLISAFC
jgi:hypothetical protein